MNILKLVQVTTGAILLRKKSDIMVCLLNGPSVGLESLAGPDDHTNYCIST